jgi:death-on-curing protein
MEYLTTDDVISMNEAEVGPDALVDFGLLESAVLRPQQSVGGHDAYPDLHTKAAAFFHSLVRNHPFVDGNKRTAVLAVTVFYGLNSMRLEGEQGEMVALALDTAEGVIDVATIAKRLSGWARDLELPDDPE